MILPHKFGMTILNFEFRDVARSAREYVVSASLRLFKIPQFKIQNLAEGLSTSPTSQQSSH